MTSWQKFEKNVKTLASFIHNSDAQKENINGVDFDCVIRKHYDYWIVVEVTENETLDKVRTDIAKFATCRQFLFSKEIFSKFYLVLKGEPTNSMKTTAKGAKVEVLSYESFSKDFFDIESYRFARNQKIFGSSVNPISGEPDTHSYIPVHYEHNNSKKELSLDDISKYLKDGKRAIMLGNYGTGKSRCIRELFQVLETKSTKDIKFTLAINLKEHWGTQRAEELIRRHLGGLGLSQMADSLIKIIHTDKFIFLLDGFDEIGAQIWSSDTSKLKQIRASSLRAVKDLINLTSSPVLITGREHYFNSEKEMLNVLGLSKSETEIVKCKDEFTLDEMNDYIKNLSLTISLPIWLPRRPLICQIINTIDKGELEKIFIDTDNAIEFWNTLIENICKREARISSALEHTTIYKILLEIAEITRTKKENTGPITIREINGAFEKVVGTAPVDDSAVMLQRLPGLSRVSSESTDRQFIDLYILDGLRADLLIEIVYSQKTEFFRKNWLNPLSKTGIEIVAKKICNDKSANTFIQFLRKAINDGGNEILIGDIISSIINHESKHVIDLEGIIINNTTIGALDFSNSLIDNVLFTESFIDEIDITNYSFTKISFKDCIIRKVYGISNASETPPFFTNSDIEIFESEAMNTTSRLSDLKPNHMIFISIIKKIFMLDSKKTEKDLQKTYGNKEDKERVSEILKILVNEKIISKPDENNCHSAKTFNRQRVLKILDQLNKSKDSLWKQIGELK